MNLDPHLGLALMVSGEPRFERGLVLEALDAARIGNKGGHDLETSTSRCRRVYRTEFDEHAVVIADKGDRRAPQPLLGRRGRGAAGVDRALVGRRYVIEQEADLDGCRRLIGSIRSELVDISPGKVHPPRLITFSTYASGRIVGDGTDRPSPATRQYATMAPAKGADGGHS